jgi:DNA repair exonuclease SbcCD ATPase subunit
MLHVEGISLYKFMAHDEVELALPKRGIVLVVGQNGKGKSALIEAVATGCWGKTLRGTPPWRDEEGRVTLTLRDVVVERRRAGKKPAVLTWNRPGERPTKYDTPTKSQDALNGIVGSYDVWRRTSVFSSADAAHFSLATDKDRKLLLEAILGLERFDVALKRCREELRDTGAKIKTFEAQVEVLNERIEGTKRRLADLDQTDEDEAAVVSPLVPEEKCARMRLLAAELTARRKQLEQESGALDREIARAESEYRARRTESERLDRDACPTCGQAIPEAQRKQLRSITAEARAAAEQLRTSVQDRRKALSEESEGIDQERDDIHTFLRKADAIAKDHARLEQLRQKRADKQTMLRYELAEQTAERDKAKERFMLFCHEYDELELCEKILGLKGVRAHMLGDAMQAITTLTNSWLRRLFPGTTILLHEEGDKVALEVKGLDHGHGYGASSSGQRRRIDIALLLALSDLEAASRGQTPGTLFLDEVADSLDEEGIQSFNDVITELAGQRAVVLISHNPGIYESLPFVQRVIVGDQGVKAA